MKGTEDINKNKEIKMPPYNIKKAKRKSLSYCILHYVGKYEKAEQEHMLALLAHVVLMHLLKITLNI